MKKLLVIVCEGSCQNDVPAHCMLHSPQHNSHDLECHNIFLILSLITLMLYRDFNKRILENTQECSTSLTMYCMF